MELKPADKATLDHVVGRFTFADDRMHQKVRTRADEQYALYCNYDSLRQRYNDAQTASERERVYGEAQNLFGATMFIPFIYSTIETMVPRMVAQQPIPRLRAANQQSEKNIPNMQCLLSQQMRGMKYAMRLQDTAKSGLIHGLGIRKGTWVHNTRNTKGLIEVDGKWGEGPITKTIYDDPMFANVDIRDWIWDPFGSDMDTIEWAIHRTWRSDEYVAAKFKSGDWTLPEGVDMDEVMRRHGDEKYQEVWSGRADANDKLSGRGNENKIHEVWEYHDGNKMILILDRECPVAVRDNPHWHGEIPFTIYRPISKPSEMIGVSVVDALEDLQIELNTMRAQRRDNASMALETPFAYQIGKIDPAHIRWGRGHAMPTMGPPEEALTQLRVNDIPASSYREEQAIKDDMQSAGGVLDLAGGGSGTADTATGAQLVYSQANERIRNMVLRLEEETIVADFNLMIQMNQQHKLELEIEVPAPPPQPGEPDARWTWLKGGPELLQGNYLPTVEPGSTAADNVPQMRNDVTLWMQLRQNPGFDGRKIDELILKNMGIAEPESYMTVDPMIPQTALDELANQLAAAGIPEDQIAQAYEVVTAQYGSQEQQEGPPGLPSPEQMPQMQPEEMPAGVE